MILYANLTQTQKNAVFTLLEARGVQLQDFRFVSEPDDDDPSTDQYVVSVLKHFPTDHYLKFGRTHNTFTPGEMMRSQTIQHYEQWKSHERIVKNWLDYLEAELAAPDLWRDFEINGDLRGRFGESPSDNTPFDEAMKSSLIEKLAALEEQLASHIADAETDRQYVRAEFQYLRDALDRLGKKDWKSATTGILGSSLFHVGKRVGLSSPAPK